MIIIGAGVIGVELGSVWSRLGAEVRLEFELLIIFELKLTYTLSSNYRLVRVSNSNFYVLTLKLVFFTRLCFNFVPLNFDFV